MNIWLPGHAHPHVHLFAERRDEARRQGDIEAVRIYDHLLRGAWEMTRHAEASYVRNDVAQFAGLELHIGGIMEPDWSLVPLVEWGPHDLFRPVPRPPIYVSGRPKTGLAGSPLHEQLRIVGELKDLCLAKRAGRHRTESQRKRWDSLAVFVVIKKPRAEALADLLGCDRRTISNLRKRGTTVLEELEDKILSGIERQLRGLEEANEQRFTMTLAALGLRPVAEAENALGGSAFPKPAL